jgi:hypothetical protein
LHPAHPEWFIGDPTKKGQTNKFRLIPQLGGTLGSRVTGYHEPALRATWRLAAFGAVFFT